ncbi:hypothetical protein [Streptomyces syringium]|uniref:Uncharacterized protein YceK n=1 Tax=Streptomyces syringium TaxID=76729 RepID=A0ABS4XW46_9ACTN|nr:hypothetical protein [Streptomyces syringium]MBP2400717.1 uncharacterized protein YceK [Streptomyces syringium]
MELATITPISVPRWSWGEVCRRAVQHYNERNPLSPVTMAAARMAGEALLSRWCVNYLRHVHTPYDVIMDQLRGPGAQAATLQWQQRIAGAIATAYPRLREASADFGHGKKEMADFVEAALAQDATSRAEHAAALSTAVQAAAEAVHAPADIRGCRASTI